MAQLRTCNTCDVELTKDNHYKNNNTNNLCKKCYIKNIRKYDTCSCGARINYKYSNDYCLPCYKSHNPNSDIAFRNPVRKQDYCDTLYDRLFPNFKWDLRDKIINDSCNKRRPDCFKDCITHCIILEIDENQHRHYNDDCELARVQELFMGLGMRPLIFIRLNIDSYKKKNKKYKSCFSHTKGTGKLKQNKEELQKRLFETHLLVDKLLDREYVDRELNGFMCKSIKLYYDD